MLCDAGLDLRSVMSFNTERMLVFKLMPVERSFQAI